MAGDPSHLDNGTLAAAIEEVSLTLNTLMREAKHRVGEGRGDVVAALRESPYSGRSALRDREEPTT